MKEKRGCCVNLQEPAMTAANTNSMQTFTLNIKIQLLVGYMHKGKATKPREFASHVSCNNQLMYERHVAL